MRTPWGPSQTVKKIGDLGILDVETASHGGFYVPRHLLKHISPEGRAYARRWSGSELWYEEDCAVAYVVAAFPEFFSNEQLLRAAETLHWINAPATLPALDGGRQ